MMHELKIWPKHFTAVYLGIKTFELRLNDRDFDVGDILFLREYDPDTKTYTGEACYRCVKYIVKEGFGLSDNVVCMSIA